MNTLSVTLRYRPLRIGWCVADNDFAALRNAMRQSFTMWGGKYNPIIPVADGELAESLVRAFRVDALAAASEDAATKAFVQAHRHLPWPMLSTQLFVRRIRGTGPLLVDIEHPVRRLYSERYKNNPSPEPGIDIWRWSEQDPIADVLLASYGDFPAADFTGKDYLALLRTVIFGADKHLSQDEPLPVWTPGRHTIDSFNATQMERDYVVQNYRDDPGFFVGHADSFVDLITFWNLKAADISLVFYDPRYADRFTQQKDFWAERIRRAPKSPGRRIDGIALWHNADRPITDTNPFGSGLILSGVDTVVWNGLNIKPPTMIFDRASALASIEETQGNRPQISFALERDPFEEDRGNHDEHYVLSIDPGIGLFRNEQATLHAPFVPELNEYYGRNAHFIWNAARAEPEGLGLISTVGTKHVNLRSLNVASLISEIFKSVGIRAEPSRPGQICRTLIQQMGGLDGCRPFKIAGVRSLIENHKPDQTFSRSEAMQAIKGQGNVRPLSEYQWLFIEPRGSGVPLKNDAVLGYLLDKAVFRPGLQFVCPSCLLPFWRSLEDSTTRLECEYCGHAFNAARQLRDKDWAFRRSGLFGRDDHQEGAIPVMLTLQQLLRMHSSDDTIYTTAMQLHAAGADIAECETDFVVLANRNRDGLLQIAIGECKTRKEITADDITKLSRVADAFPTDRYEVYIVISRLTPLTPDEIALVKTLNTQWRRRAIILTERELEPYFVYERTEVEFDIKKHAVTFGDMALITQQVFFDNRRRPPNSA